MKCPNCNNTSTRVHDSRPARNNSTVKRRRYCPECQFKFSTEESIQIELPMVIKKDGRREPFQKAKIEKGINLACQKRAISTNQLDLLVKNIIEKISNKGGSEISSDLIGKYVMTELRKLDEVAYVRFASVYMTFKEVNEFFESIGSDLI